MCRPHCLRMNDMPEPYADSSTCCEDQLFSGVHSYNVDDLKQLSYMMCVKSVGMWNNFTYWLDTNPFIFFLSALLCASEALTVANACLDNDLGPTVLGIILGLQGVPKHKHWHPSWKANV